MSGSLNVWEPARAKTIGDWPAFCGGGVHVLGRDGEWHAAPVWNWEIIWGMG